MQGTCSSFSRDRGPSGRVRVVRMLSFALDARQVRVPSNTSTPVNRMRTLLLPSFLAVSIAFVTPGDSLGFKVEAKAKLSKTFATKLDMHSTEMSITFDGQDAHGGMEGPKVSFSDEEHVEIVDEYVAVAAGRPTKLVRSFDKLSGKSMQNVEAPQGAEEEGGGEESHDKSSELEGKKVGFSWKDDEWSAAWPEGVKGDDDLLAELDGDLDFLGFLPGKSVSDGDAWDLDAKLFNKVMSPGGDLHLKTAKDGEDTEQEDQIGKTIEDNLGGKASATYKGTREEGGVTLAVIEIKAELSSKGTIDEDEGKSAIDAAMELEGEVLWDPKAGHLHSFKITGKMSFGMESTRQMEFGDESHEFSQKVRFEGEVEYTAKVD